MHQQRQVAEIVIHKLLSCGYEAYFVGGFVRDFLLNKPAKDIDISTNALPHQVEALFDATIPTGLQHGTVTVVIDHIPIEVTTFRAEGAYLDSRRPSKVHFISSLEQDLSRRDFTINAMAMDIKGEIYDPFSGQEDIRNGWIRAVGDAQERFREDSLRILRAIRFASQFQYQIETKTKKALLSEKEACRNLSQERITAEWEKIWLGNSPMIGVQYGFAFDLWGNLSPFSKWRWSKLNENALPHFNHTSDRLLQWAYLLSLADTDRNNIKARGKGLRLSKLDIQQLHQVYVASARWKSAQSERDYKLLLLEYGHLTVERAICLCGISSDDISSQENKKRQITSIWNEIIVKQVTDLDIQVPELIVVVDKPPGPWIKEVLSQLLQGVALGEINNTRENLLKEGYRIGTANTK